MKGVWSRIAALVTLIIAISYLQSIPLTAHASLRSTYDQDDPVTAIIPSASENLEFKRHVPQNPSSLVQSPLKFGSEMKSAL